jgi:GMP synthase (glutamine-hydrolysing)
MVERALPEKKRQLEGMRAVVIQHEEGEGLGLFGPALEAEGFGLVKRYRQVRREDLAAELLVVLGGPMGALETAQHPFLRDELALLSERLASDQPVLGVGLGAQLVASAAGAEVFEGKNGFEVGAAPVRWTQAGLSDEVIAGVARKTVVAHRHQDTFGPVPGAVLLASTDRYVQQAFRLGTSYAFQFHLELTAPELDTWLTRMAAELTGRGKDVAELRAGLGKLRGAEAELRSLVERLAHHFARTVR